jgi:uncharacterized FlgJ-related protein
MLYYYDKKSLEYRFAKKPLIITIVSGLIIISALVVTSSFLLVDKKVEKKIKNNPNIIDISAMEPEEVIVVVNNVDEFSEEKLKDYILELNIKHPDIAFAQARYESGNWGTNPGAKMFGTNNNLFGMKCATSRTTTHQGEQHGHAYYSHWRMSVIDYAMWQDAYARDLKSREDYIAYLKRVYAMGTYVSIMQIIKEVRKKYPELCVKTYPKLNK